MKQCNSQILALKSLELNKKDVSNLQNDKERTLICNTNSSNSGTTM